MKKLLTLCLALMLLLTTGCGGQTEKTQEPNPPSSEISTEPTHTDPVQTTPDTEPTEPGIAQTEPAEGYLERIPLADQSIFSEPSYDSTFVGVVGKATKYTIVEEATDDEGNLWGKLKSGLGWVDLTEIRSGEREKLPVTVNFADEALLADDNTLRFVQGDADYAIPIAIRPQKKLLSFSIAHYTLTGEDYEIGENLYYIDTLTPETPLVADLVFFGDFTQFIITFMEEDGSVHNYAIGESGRNGTIYMNEVYVQ